MRGMIVACSILLVMVLAVFLATSPQTSGFLDLYQNGGFSPATGASVQMGSSGFSFPW